jgi:hypothetical protein
LPTLPLGRRRNKEEERSRRRSKQQQVVKMNSFNRKIVINQLNGTVMISLAFGRT